MRKTVLMPVEKVLCDAHMARDGSEQEATETLALGARSWDLCSEHSSTFTQYLTDALGIPEAPSVQAAEVAPVAAAPEPVVVTAEPVAVPEPSPALAEGVNGETSNSEPVRSVMLAGEVPGYDWESARDAVRNAGFEVVGRADGSTVLLILGEGGERNGTKLRDASERGIPCMDVREPGRFKSAVLSGEFTGGDPLPEPAKVDRSGMSTRERNKVIRAWARANGWPNLPAQGRVPMDVRFSYENAHAEDVQGKAAAA